MSNIIDPVREDQAAADPSAEMVCRELEATRAELGRALAELSRTRAELVEARTLEAVGRLAAGVAHEINTPVQYIGDNMTFLGRAFAELVTVAQAARAAAAAPPSTPEQSDLCRALARAKIDFLVQQAPRALEQSRDGLARVAAMVGAMKDFARAGGREKEPVDLGRLIDTTVVVSRNEWKYVAEVETAVDASLPHVPARRRELGQVLLHLVVSAARSIAEARAERPGDKGLIRVSARREGALALIEISGDGARATMEQALGIARDVVVDQHGGRVQMQRVGGRGWALVIALPLEDPPRVERPIEAEARAAT